MAKQLSGLECHVSEDVLLDLALAFTVLCELSDAILREELLRLVEFVLLGVIALQRHK